MDALYKIYTLMVDAQLIMLAILLLSSVFFCCFHRDYPSVCTSFFCFAL